MDTSEVLADPPTSERALTDATGQVLRAAAEDTGDGIVAYVPVLHGDRVVDLRFVYLNASYRRMNPLASVGAMASVNPANLAQVIAHADEAWHSDSACSFTMRVAPVEPPVPWERIDASIRRIGGMLLEVDRDATAEERLQVHHDEVLDALTEAVMVIRPIRDDSGVVVDGEFRYANRAVFSLYASPFGAGSLVGRRLAEVPGLMTTRTLANVARASAGETVVDRLDLRSAEFVWARFRFASATYRSGPHDTVIVVVEDRTEEYAASEDLQRSQDLIQTVLDTLNEAVVVATADRRVILRNQAAAFAVRTDDAGHEYLPPFRLSLPDGEPLPTSQLLSDTIRDGGPVRSVLVHSDLTPVEREVFPGVPEWATISAKRLESDPGVAVIGIHDVSDVMATRSQLERAQALQDQAMEHLRDAVIVWRRAPYDQFEIEYANPAAGPWLPHPPPVRLDELPLLEATRNDLYGALMAVAQTGEAVTYTVRLRNEHDPSQHHAARLTNTALPDGGIATLIVDLSAEEAEAASLRERALRDPESGLLNRSGFEAEVAELLASPHLTLAVMAIELDQLEVIERSMGLAAAVELMHTAITRLRDAVPERAVVARLASAALGVALLDVASVHDVETMAAAATEAISRPVSLAGPALHVGATAGLTFSPLHGTVAADLVGRARLAALEARTVQTPVLMWRPGMEDRSAERVELLAEIDRALSAGEFSVAFQPKIDRSGRFVGAEALARWMHPQLGAIPTTSFIAVLEQSTLSRRFTAHVATIALREWRRSGLPGRVAVNLPAALASDPKLVELMTDVLVATGCPAHLVELEVTERGLVPSDRLASENFHRLRELGIRIAIDDFGTGNASLSYLRTLKADEVKIDRWFITHVDADAVNQAVVTAVVGMAAAIGLVVVAEGVESAAELEMAWRLGCDVAQGYVIGAPMPIAALSARVQADGFLMPI